MGTSIGIVLYPDSEELDWVGPFEVFGMAAMGRDIEALRESQKKSEFGSKDYWEIDRRLRSRLLKEIQIIIDAYVVAEQGDRLEEWESMYGDIEHYKREFFYFRMDQDYEKREKMLHDYKMIEE